MSSRQYLINAATKHQVFLQRYAGSTYKGMQIFLKDAIRATETLLRGAGTTMSRERYVALSKELESVQKAIYADMAKGTKNRLSELAAYEAAFTERLIKYSTNGVANFRSPSVDQLQAAAFTTIIDKRNVAMNVGQALEDFGAAKGADIAKTVRVGFALGKTVTDIADDITSITPMINRQAQTLAKTLTNHVATQSRKSFYKANDDIITGYQVVATLDDRTSLECCARDGIVADIEDFEFPPYHWNCRTTYIAVIDKQYDIGSELDGDRAAVGSDGVEHVSTQTRYNGWLKTQPASFQDEVLGQTRGELFRAGMPVTKFVDSNYQPLTIDELQTKDTQHIFDKAGL